MTTQDFKNVADLYDSLEVSKSNSQKFRDDLNQRKLSRGIFILRNLAGITQSDFAEMIGTTEAVVEEMETSSDSYIAKWINNRDFYLASCLGLPSKEEERIP